MNLTELISFYEWNTLSITHSIILYTLSLTVIVLTIKLINLMYKS